MANQSRLELVVSNLKLPVENEYIYLTELLNAKMTQSLDRFIKEVDTGWFSDEGGWITV